MNVIKKLAELSGHYEGQGINHDKESFTGKLTLTSILEGKGIEIEYTATGKDGTYFHIEKSIISYDFSGNVKMWNLNNNSPGMAELEQRTTDNGVIFGIGNINDGNTFREEIKIELNSSSIGYHYSWGMPGGDFTYRSGLVMNRV